MVFRSVGQAVFNGIDTVTSATNEALFEPVIRLGVTGLARSGKTVFITSLIANLLERGRMSALPAVAQDRIEAAWLHPQPDNTVPRFPFETHLDAMTGATPFWPESTASISELRLSLRVRPQGLFGGLRGPSTIHLDIVDYPGEWLLDLGLMGKSYADWSAQALEQVARRDTARAFQELATTETAETRVDERTAQTLAESFTAYLHAARKAGHHDVLPGRFLLPGDLKGAPVLTFAPLPPLRGRGGRGTLYREFERRFEAYKREVVRPFFRDHFSRIDRQIVLVDLLGALDSGPHAVADLQAGLGNVLNAFKPGANAWLTSLLGVKRVERILFAASKADHLHHSQHDRMAAIVSAMLAEARRRADFSGARSTAMAIAALRCTTEDQRQHQGQMVDLVQGRLADGRHVAVHAGVLPEEPQAILAPGLEGFASGHYASADFQPAALSMKPGMGPPHIRLDRAAAFLFGDKL